MTTSRQHAATLHREQLLDRVLGGRLRRAREDSGLSLNDLAELTGLPRDELMDHETGTLPIPAVRLGYLEDLFGRLWARGSRPLPLTATSRDNSC